VADTTTQDLTIECTPVCLDIDQVKELYDTLAEKIYNDMDKQYKEGKINGATYADTWAKLMSSVISGSMNTIAQIQMKETAMDRCVKQEQCNQSKKQQELLDKQIEQTERQTKGFDDNKEQKMLEAQLNAWAMMFSSGLLEDMPDIINSDEVTKLYCKMADELGIPCHAKEIKRRIEAKLKKKIGSQ
jgi:hypothetical protein